jgi:CDP-glycerol glycerophosphotransferase (TagB/SpsB family)
VVAVQAKHGRNTRSENGAPSHSGTILFATQPLQDRGFVEAVTEALLEVSDAKILIRPHPSEHDTDVHRRLAKLHPERVRFVGGLDLFDTLREVDVLVCQNSTVVIEAALLSVPSITVNFTGLPDFSPYVACGLAPQATTRQQLSDMVRALLAGNLGKTHTEWAAKGDTLREALIGPADGLAAARAAQLVVNILAKAKSALAEEKLPRQDKE